MWGPTDTGDRVVYLCSCSWLPLLSFLLGHAYDFVGVRGHPCPGSWAWLWQCGEGVGASGGVDGECYQP